MANAQDNFELCQKQLDLFQDGPVVIFKWINDPQWTIEMVTGNIQRLLGYSAEELVDNRISYKQIILPTDLERVIAENALLSHNSGQGRQYSTYQLLTKSGRVVCVHDHTVPIHDTNHRITHYLGYLVDVTEQVQAENELRESEKKYRGLLDNLQSAVFLHKL